jgi:predicted lipoprotein with Yx(FWY)xxD motif
MDKGILRAAAALVFIPLALAACGSSAAPSSSAPSVAPATTATPTPAPTPTPAAAAALIQIGSATVAGASTTVLTSSQGLTLYYRTADTATSISCTGGCAANWPPVLLASGTPTGSTAVTGSLTVFAGPNGNQVLYNGHPLYRWIMDSAPGQATGQGVGGFKVATPGLAAG